MRPVTSPTPARAPLPPLTLVLGGAESGKSVHAERLAEARDGPLLYIATAEPLDEEMTARVARHRARRGPRWRTREVPLALPEAIRAADAETAAVLVDCLTLWLANLMGAERDPAREAEALAAALARTAAPVILVSNEVGLGIVPENPLARRFREHAGRLNRAFAAAADRVDFLAAGIPLALKSPGAAPSMESNAI